MKNLGARAAVAILVLGIAATIGVCVRCGDWNDGQVAMALFTLWAISPYGGFMALTLRRRRSQAVSWILAGGALVAVLFGVGALVDGFIVHLDAQSGLLFIFVPLWQWVGWIPFALLSALTPAQPSIRSR